MVAHLSTFAMEGARGDHNLRANLTPGGFPWVSFGGLRDPFGTYQSPKVSSCGANMYRFPILDREYFHRYALYHTEISSSNLSALR